jgi:hypothetical protein
MAVGSPDRGMEFPRGKKWARHNPSTNPLPTVDAKLRRTPPRFG